MKISTLIADLEAVRKEHGEIEVALQDDGKGETGRIVGYESFFVVAEEYDEDWLCNLRWWPY